MSDADLKVGTKLRLRREQYVRRLVGFAPLVRRGEVFIITKYTPGEILATAARLADIGQVFILSESDVEIIS